MRLSLKEKENTVFQTQLPMPKVLHTSSVCEVPHGFQTDHINKTLLELNRGEEYTLINITKWCFMYNWRNNRSTHSLLTQENPNTSIQKGKKLTQIWESGVESKLFKCSVQKAKWHKTKPSKMAIPRNKANKKGQQKPAAQQLRNTLSLWQTILKFQSAGQVLTC